MCVCVEGGGKKHGTVTNSTFELEVVSGSLEAMLLPYYEFGCVTNSTSLPWCGARPVLTHGPAFWLTKLG